MRMDVFQFGVRKIRVWPHDQVMQRLDEPRVWMTDFADHVHYHPKLTQRILSLEQGSEFRDPLFRGACGVKVRHPGRWACIEAELVQARAIALFKRVHQCDAAVVDDSWASVYHRHDYCAPHSHTRALSSVLYFLDPGDPPDPDDIAGGRFCFADPRMRVCCPEQEGRMTRLLVPDLRPGTMMLFPAEFMHHVNPYLGSRPRITLSWNLAMTVVRGKPGTREDYIPA